MVEYLFQRVRKNRVKPNLQDYAFDRWRIGFAAFLFRRLCLFGAAHPVSRSMSSVTRDVLLL